MADVTRSSKASVDPVSAMYAPQLSEGLVAGEALPACAPCYVDDDGKVWLCDGTALNAKTIVDGITARQVNANEPVTLFGNGVKFSLTDAPITKTIRTLYLSANKGEWSTTATTGDPQGHARMIPGPVRQLFILHCGNPSIRVDADTP